MPGPGPHLMYSLGMGILMTSLSDGRFTPHHCVFYSINSFFGPDIGSFSEWITSKLGAGEDVGSLIMARVHHPLYYALLLGLPLSLFYSWISKVLLRKGILITIAGVPLNEKQCFHLVFAGSLSHFFLDHLFEENGRTKMLTWILSTGSWESPVASNSCVIAVGTFCILLLGGYIYINRSKPAGNLETSNRTRHSLILVGAIAALYCVWCAIQIYCRQPRVPAVGEEAELGVLVFLAVFFFLPHALCVTCMHSSDIVSEYGRLPLVHNDI